MRRRSIHLAFGAVALCCAAFAGYGWVRLQHAQAIDAVIAANPVANPAANAMPRAGQVAGAAPELRLARAMALSRAGDYVAATRLYSDLARQAPHDALGRAALFDLANMYLREGTVAGAQDAIKSLPMLEQAKERYRELLRIDAGDWDARYNLERALWLAPETGDPPADRDAATQNAIKQRGSVPGYLP